MAVALCIGKVNCGNSSRTRVRLSGIVSGTVSGTSPTPPTPWCTTWGVALPQCYNTHSSVLFDSPGTATGYSFPGPLCIAWCLSSASLAHSCAWPHQCSHHLHSSLQCSPMCIERFGICGALLVIWCMHLCPPLCSFQCSFFLHHGYCRHISSRSHHTRLRCMLLESVDVAMSSSSTLSYYHLLLQFTSQIPKSAVYI